MSEPLPERGIADLIGDAFDTLARAPLLILGTFAALELAWALPSIVASVFGERLVQEIIAQDAELTPALVQAMMKWVVAGLLLFFAFMLAMVFAYAFAFGVVEYAVKEALERRKPDPNAAFAYARPRIFETMRSLGAFSLAYVPAIVLGMLAAQQLIAGFSGKGLGSGVGISLLLMVFALGAYVIGDPIFRLVVGTGAFGPKRGLDALAEAWAVARARFGEVILIALVLVVAAVVVWILGLLLQVPLPSTPSKLDFDILNDKLDAKSLMKKMFEPKPTAMWVAIYRAVVQSICYALREGFAFLLVAVWFARRAGRLSSNA